MKKKPWSGRFLKDTDRLVEEFTASIPFDRRLYKYDIRGSIAHVRMLSKVRIISEEEAEKIVGGLKEIEGEIEEGRFKFSTELEDIHMNIEHRLIDKIGEMGGKLHTARSRNDQAALDLRLYLRDEIRDIGDLIRSLQKAIIKKAKENIDCIMPGYTHLQPAQPVLFSHYILAYYEMLQRDVERMEECFERVNVMPLGSGALSGTTFPIDRKYVARLLDFPRVTENSIDAVGDRDFVIEFLSVAAILMMHLSRLSEELVLWSTREFGFVELPESYCTGSSMMPQKKNPDVPELIRGKSGRVYGSLISILTMMKGLPLAYNKDMQEDKEALFDAVDTLKGSLRIYRGLIDGLIVRPEAMKDAAEKGFLTATDLADYLSRKGMPFRDAHEVVGRVVRYCLNKKKNLSDLTSKELQGFSPKFDEDAMKEVFLDQAIKRRDQRGGTAKNRVLQRIREIERMVKIFFLVLTLGLSLISFSGCGRKGDPMVPEPPAKMQNNTTQFVGALNGGKR